MSEVFKPNGERVLLRKKKFEEKKQNGIILPTTENQESSYLAEVVEMGNAFTEKSCEILGFKKGSTVRARNHAFEEIEVNDEKLRITQIESVLGHYENL